MHPTSNTDSFEEIAAILARGYLRWRQSQPVNQRGVISGLEVHPPSSVHASNGRHNAHPNPNPSTALGMNHQGDKP